MNSNRIHGINGARKLVEIYKSILDGLEDKPFSRNGEKYLNKAMGFGKRKTCILCESVSGECFDCIWKFKNGCVNANYVSLSKSKTEDEFKYHLINRIKTLEHKIILFETFYKYKQF